VESNISFLEAVDLLISAVSKALNFLNNHTHVALFNIECCSMGYCATNNE
jgi:hypothetical protein